MTALITLTTAGADSGPFNLYSNLDGYASAFEVAVPKVDLLAGYASSLVPDFTTTIRVLSTGTCTTYIDIILEPMPTTTTTSSSSTSTTTSTSSSTSTTTSTSTSSSSTTTTTTTILVCESYTYNNTSGELQTINWIDCNTMSTIATGVSDGGSYSFCAILGSPFDSPGGGDIIDNGTCPTTTTTTTPIP
jgi:hypothetical protein